MILDQNSKDPFTRATLTIHGKRDGFGNQREPDITSVFNGRESEVVSKLLAKVQSLKLERARRTLAELETSIELVLYRMDARSADPETLVNEYVRLRRKAGELKTAIRKIECADGLCVHHAQMARGGYRVECTCNKPLGFSQHLSTCPMRDQFDAPRKGGAR